MPSEHELTAEQVAQLDKLQGTAPDTQDIPEASAENWDAARRGAFFRPHEEAISIRLDLDVLDWLRRQGRATRQRSTEFCATT